MRRRHPYSNGNDCFLYGKKQSIIRLDARLQHAGMTTGEGVAGLGFLSSFRLLSNSNDCFLQSKKTEHYSTGCPPTACGHDHLRGGGGFRVFGLCLSSSATAMTVFYKAKKQSIIRLDARLQHAGMTTGEGVAGFVFLVFV